MILPGDIFLKKSGFKFKDNLHIGIVLLAINIFVFLFLTWPDDMAEKKIFKSVTENNFLEIENLRNMYDQVSDPLSSSVMSTDHYYFLRDTYFWSQADRFPFKGDLIGIDKGRKILNQIEAVYKNSKQYQFGLAPEATSPWAWITYQFTHAGFFHLLTNMIFLVLITNILVRVVQGEWIALVYILGGIGAGVSYLLCAANSEIAMVGASGSLCALISFLCVIKNKKNICWSYFISPIKGGYGQIYMPAYLLFPVYLVSDLTSVLYHTNGVHQAIAHSAHIGGAVIGFILGAVYLLIHFLRSKTSAHGVLGDHNRFHKLF